MRAIYYGYLKHSVDGIEIAKPDPHRYGLPEIKKFPMPDAKHVKSAIKFFNYVEPKYEKRLAREILKRMKEYGMTNINVGPDNKFRKYYKNGDEV